MKKRKTRCFLSCLLILAMIFANLSLPASVVNAAEADFDATFSDLSFDSSSTWSEPDGNSVDLTSLATDSAPEGQLTLTFTVLLPKENADFSGMIKFQGVLRVGDDWTWTQSDTIPEFGAEDFTEVTIDNMDYVKAEASIPFDVEVDDYIAAVTIKIAGYQCDYSGDIYLQNVALTEETSDSDDSAETVISWDFTDGIDGWYYNSGWNSSYDGEGSVSHEEEMLKVDVDYSANSSSTWSQTAVSYSTSEGMDLSDVNSLTMDFYYNPAAKTTGSLKVKAYADFGINVDLDVDEENAEDVTVGDAAMKKVSVTFSFDALTETAATDFSIALIGYMTDYQGSLYLDNVAFCKTTSTEEIYVNSTIAVDDQTNLAVSDGVLTSQTMDGSDETTAIADTVTLVDGNATEETAKTYALLQTLGTTESVIFGHQNDTWHKAGSSSLGDSDVEDITQSISGVVGLDTLSLTGNEYSAGDYNDTHTDQVDIGTLGEELANVTAAALLTNECIEDGAIITLSAHMPNFANIELNEDYDEDTDPTYAKYDFGVYTPNDLTGDVMNEILPGGEYNEVYTAFLDLVADYANQVDGTVLFRPFHENTGSWFWWGAAFCDAETYKSVYRYTVEYLRDEKGVHNFLYEYGPGSEAADTDEYAERYPGDDYVDIIGFDMYNTDPQEDNSSWLTSFKNELAIVEEFAQSHGKLVAVTETGVACSDGGALLKSGNLDKDWFAEVTDVVSDSSASYFLVWANWGESSDFYTPYVKSVNEDGTLYGHEMLDNFISFFNDARTVFADNLNGLLNQMSAVTIQAVSTSATGYFTSPVSGSRILEATTITAKVTGAEADTMVQFALHGDGVDVTLDASSEDGSYYNAVLDAETLASLGEYVGTIELLIDGTSVSTMNAIFNIQPAEEDPYQIDGFENYSGVDSLLNNAWATNKATGSTITLSLTQEEGKVFEGDYALSFTYKETSDGWAGATISKEVDWSDCNALQFYTIPDGNNQKVVIQLTANGICYEAYLNLYEDYANTTEAILVTIPFSAFCQRDTEGNPTGGLVDDCASVTSFGLWVNAISGSNAIDEDGYVSGTIYYDDITAVSTDLTEVTVVSATAETETVDITALTATIEEAKALTESDYTAETWSALQTALTAAETVAGNGYATQEEVDAAASALTSAIHALEKAQTGGGNGSAGTSVVAPAATKIISLINKTKGIKITWNKVSGASSYQIYRKVGNGSWKKVKTTTSVSWKDTSAAENGVKYKYKVYAVNEKGISKASAVKSIVRLKSSRITTAKNASGKKISLRWTRNAKATGYQIQYSTSKSFSKVTTVKIKGNKIVAKTLKGLKKGKKYYVRIRSYKKSSNVTSYSAWSKTKKVVIKK